MARTATKRKTATKRTTVAKKKPAVKKATAAKKKPAAKKPAAKKTTARKTTTRKAVTKSLPKKQDVVVKKSVTTAVKEGFTKTETFTTIAETTGLTKKQVTAVFEEFGNIIERHIKRRAVGQFTVPGLMKIMVVRKPATKARKGINPFTGEETVFKAKPARNVVKVRALKKLKDMAE